MTGDAVQAVLATLESAPALLRSLVHEIPEPLRKRRPLPAKWSAHEHAVHLASVHSLFLGRLERLLAEDNPRIEPWQPSPEEEQGSLLDADLNEALERFARDREETVWRLRSLPEEAWQRRGEHPLYEDYSIFTMARNLAVHDGLHIYRIEELRYKKDWQEEPAPPPGPVPVQEGIPGSRARMQAGEVNVLGPFEVPGLTPRHVRVYLPRDYTPEFPSYALYLFDGQNLFGDEGAFSGGWHIHEAAEGLARARRPVPVVIGIDHGGESRIVELSPFQFDGKPGQIHDLLDWLTGTLMPALTAELNLHPAPLGAVIGGSSMGGLAAFWSHFHYPHAFGGALVMSPSFWVANQAIFEDIADLPTPEPSRIYLDMGAKEDKGRQLPIAAAMAAHLVGRGYDDDRLLWRPDARGGHNEASWRKRLPKALRFMYR
ncbi:MAG TPA: alpha/beta hydrolase-fold protein [Thermoanaerobaculia bacterium]